MAPERGVQQSSKINNSDGTMLVSHEVGIVFARGMWHTIINVEQQSNTLMLTTTSICNPATCTTNAYKQWAIQGNAL